MSAEAALRELLQALRDGWSRYDEPFAVYDVVGHWAIDQPVSSAWWNANEKRLYAALRAAEQEATT